MSLTDGDRRSDSSATPRGVASVFWTWLKRPKNTVIQCVRERNHRARITQRAEWELFVRCCLTDEIGEMY